MRILSWAVLSVGMVFCAQTVEASVVLGNFTVDGKQSVVFAGRTQSELTLIADAADPTTDRLDDLQNDISDYASIAPTAISIVGYDQLSITANGLWMHTAALSPNGTGPGGLVNNSRTTAAAYQLFGISGMAADLNTLVGVFLSDDLPDPNNTPALLSALDGDDMTSPLLAQTFAIGESLSGIIVPDGATRLFLGMHDGREWSNNSGSVTATVTAVPEPATLVVWSLLGMLGLVGYKKWKS